MTDCHCNPETALSLLHLQIPGAPSCSAWCQLLCSHTNHTCGCQHVHCGPFFHHEVMQGADPFGQLVSEVIILHGQQMLNCYMVSNACPTDAHAIATFRQPKCSTVALTWSTPCSPFAYLRWLEQQWTAERSAIAMVVDQLQVQATS